MLHKTIVAKLNSLVDDNNEVDETKEWLTLNETAKFMCLHPQTLHAYIRNNKSFRKLKRKVGGKVLFSRSEVDEYIREECLVEVEEKKADRVY